MSLLTPFPQQNTIRVLAADSTSMNTQMLVEALARDGQFTMAGSASKPAEILAWTRKEHPHVALRSARQGDNGTAGFELCRDICSGSPSTRVIMLLDFSERTAVIEAFRSGDTLEDISKRLGRTLRAIEARLLRLGLITPEQRETQDTFSS